MHFFALLPTLLLAARCASAQDSDQSTITSTATLACPTGDAQSKFESCSSSISSKIDECDDNDFSCACSYAVTGFSCLTSYCPAQTENVCAGSYVLQNLCGTQVPTLTALTCPTTIPGLLASLIPSDISSFISSNVRSFLPSDINSRIPSGIPFWNGPAQTGGDDQSMMTTATQTSGGSGTETAIQAPSQTGAAGGAFGGRREGADGVSVFLGLGVVVSVVVGGLAAYL